MKLLKNFFELLLRRYRIGLEISMILSLIVFIYCVKNAIKINANQGGSYIDSPGWMKNKNATISPINKKDNKCFRRCNNRIIS